MKKNTRALALLMALSTITAAGCGKGKDTTTDTGKTDKNFNATGYPIVNEKVTLKALIPNTADHPKDINDIPVVKKAEDITNVHIEWIMPGSGFNEKKSLMLASGDLPDFILQGVTTLEQVKYGADGTFIPQEDLIDKYAPNLKKIYEQRPQIKAYITAPDGHIYATPRINEGPWMKMEGVGIINKTWLDNLGLQMPTNLDEFYTVMKAFKTQDPNKNGQADEIPVSFQGRVQAIHGFSYLMSSFGFTPNDQHRDIINGKAVLTATLPQYKEGIKFLSKLYREGLIDTEGFTNTYQQYSARLSKDPFTVGYTQVWDINDNIGNANAHKEYEYLPPLKGFDGKDAVIYKLAMPGYDRNGAVITSACKNPEIAMRYIDYIYDEKNSMEWIEGEFDKRLIKQPEGYYIVSPPPAGQTTGQHRYANSPGHSAPWAVFEDSYRNTLRLTFTDRKVEFMDKKTIPLADKDPFPPVFYTVEEAEKMNQLNTDLLALVERKASEWIMKGNVDAEWDAYIKELEKIGLQDWLKINQAAYDRYIKK